ncbi:hypothetical protein RV14_GL001782 [Enterococcus ratti]|uniref:Uncharacterized protein n=1 Tax=Enterococcus ratti TaxID=150033 RepID=A0A1L8WQ02_9ENTE|nr:hypothetical protein RV14_GL001782 [Enterococcus ratti]
MALGKMRSFFQSFLLKKMSKPVRLTHVRLKFSFSFVL